MKYDKIDVLLDIFAKINRFSRKINSFYTLQVSEPKKRIFMSIGVNT